MSESNQNIEIAAKRLSILPDAIRNSGLSGEKLSKVFGLASGARNLRILGNICMTAFFASLALRLHMNLGEVAQDLSAVLAVGGLLSHYLSQGNTSDALKMVVNAAYPQTSDKAPKPSA